MSCKLSNPAIGNFTKNIILPLAVGKLKIKENILFFVFTSYILSQFVSSEEGSSNLHFTQPAISVDIKRSKCIYLPI